jgi:hypothetical protein
MHHDSSHNQCLVPHPPTAIPPHTDDYRSHTSCISEAERYEKTVFRGVRKSDQNNGDANQKAGRAHTKQEKWTQTIQRAAELAPPSLKSYMNQLTMLENIPTKEKQFRNFAVNSLRLKKSDERITTQIWELLVKQKRADEANDPTKQRPNREQVVSDSAIRTETKREDTHEEPTKLVSDNDDTPSETHFPSDASVKKIMKKALKKASNKKLKFKVLRQTVKDALYQKANDTTTSELERLGKKQWNAIVERIIRENPDKMKLDGKSVLLIES